MHEPDRDPFDSVPRRPRILSVSYSPLTRDARVLRQLDVLSSFGDVTTLGYGPAPDAATDHLRVPDGLASLPQTPTGVLRLAARLLSSAQWAAPAVRWSRTALAGRSFDLVVANDARALPVAFEAAAGAPVWADMHEWAPEEQSHSLPWRLLVAPLMTWLCGRYLPEAAAVSTVSPLIAELYRERFGIAPVVVRNARDFVDLEPSPVVDGRIRLVHSGIAAPERCIETLIDATLALDERFTLDLVLVFGDRDSAYRNALQARAARSDRIRFLDPVTPAQLPFTLNVYDLGVYVLRPETKNHELMLPNKFFDFVQARLGVVFGPAVELDRLIAENGLGVTTAGFDAADLVSALTGLTADRIREFKQHASDAAAALSSATDRETQETLVASVLERPAG